MKECHVLSLGAGVQSTALYLMFMEGIIPSTLDAAVFADTQGEPDAVYRHLEWLQSLNGPPILVRSVGKLADDLVNGRNSTGGRFASIPAFTTADHGKTVGITRRQCSKEYKTQVIDRTIRREMLGLAPRQRVPRGITVYQYIGMSFDEMGRAHRVSQVFKKRAKWARPVFPLIERFMTRANCFDWLAGRVPHETPRSACTFCPYHSDHEWDRLKREDAKGWARAVEVDKALRTQGSVVNRALDQVLYLHRSCVPLELVQLDNYPRSEKSADDDQLRRGVHGDVRRMREKLLLAVQGLGFEDREALRHWVNGGELPRLRRLRVLLERGLAVGTRHGLRPSPDLELWMLTEGGNERHFNSMDQ